MSLTASFKVGVVADKKCYQFKTEAAVKHLLEYERDGILVLPLFRCREAKVAHQ